MELTFYEAYKLYEKFFCSNFKARSIDSAYSIFLNYLIPYFSNMKMKEISKLDIIEFENDLDRKKLSYKYKKDIYVFLAMFFKFCNKYLDLKENVCRDVGFILKNKSVEHQKTEIWSLKEFKKFIKQVKRKDYKIFFEFLFFTGCRFGEVQALRFCDIKNGIVSIERTTIKGNRGFNSPKTPGSNRKFKIDYKMMKEILKLKKEYQKKFKNFDESFFIFGGNKMFSHSTVTRIKNECCKKAKVKQIRIHDFRHSHITILISKGIPIKAICERVGHKDANMTLNVYAHVLKSDEKKLINSLNMLHFRMF